MGLKILLFVKWVRLCTDTWPLQWPGCVLNWYLNFGSDLMNHSLKILLISKTQASNLVKCTKCYSAHSSIERWGDVIVSVHRSMTLHWFSVQLVPYFLLWWVYSSKLNLLPFWNANYSIIKGLPGLWRGAGCVTWPVQQFKMKKWILKKLSHTSFCHGGAVYIYM